MVELNKKISEKTGYRTIKSGFYTQENLVDRAKYFLMRKGVRPCQIKELACVHADVCGIVEEKYLNIAAHIVLKQFGINNRSDLFNRGFGLYDVAIPNTAQKDEMFYISSFFVDDDNVCCILSSVETGNPLLMFCPNIEWDIE